MNVDVERKKYTLMRIVTFLCLLSIYLFIDLCLYNLLLRNGQNNYFFFIPLSIWLITTLGRALLKYHLPDKLNITTTLIALICLCLIENAENIKIFYLTNRNIFLVVLLFSFFVGLLILKCNTQTEIITNAQNSRFSEQNLFNLFYINTSKVHEIVMLWSLINVFQFSF